MNADLLQDLTSYTSSRDKGVVNAARSLITLYREVAPEMLLRKDRGKVVSMAMSNGEVIPSLKFGVERGVKTGIEGLELLEAYKKEQNELNGEEDEDEDEDGTAKLPLSTAYLQTGRTGKLEVRMMRIVMVAADG
jgi:protein SDA1